MGSNKSSSSFIATRRASDTPKPRTIGERIRHVRTERALTYDDLVRRTGLSKSFLWAVEHDQSDISGEKLLRLANALEASLDFLLRGERPAPSKPSAPVEIPSALAQFATERGLSLEVTIRLVEAYDALRARRRARGSPRMTKEDWRSFYEAVRPFCEQDR
jgi:transcriptional regulator with XRE-family HTH domain